MHHHPRGWRLDGDIVGRPRTCFEGTPEAVTAIAKFLEACCGYRPTSATSNLDPDVTAKKLVEELGEWATLDAMLKADEAAGKGDEEGHEFWMRVHEIAIKLTGG